MKKYLFLFLLVSCYSQKKATQQFGKAAATYPIIPAQYCAITYPPKTTVLKGDTVTLIDTLQMAGNVITDTLVSLDTIRITTTKTLPGQTITKTVHVTDTISIENTAQLKVCELERGKTLDLLGDANTKLDVSQGKAKKRSIIMWSLIAAIVIYSGWKIYGMFKPKV